MTIDRRALMTGTIAAAAAGVVAPSPAAASQSDCIGIATQAECNALAFAICDAQRKYVEFGAAMVRWFENRGDKDTALVLAQALGDFQDQLPNPYTMAWGFFSAFTDIYMSDATLQDRKLIKYADLVAHADEVHQRAVTSLGLAT